jgi:hypothetical protein
MPLIKRYGALSFVGDGCGGLSVAAVVAENYPLAAIVAAGRLRAALINQVSAHVGAVAFEWPPENAQPERVACLFRTGRIPGDDAVRALVAFEVGSRLPLLSSRAGPYARLGE